MRSDTIVGYIYQADVHCPFCVIEALPTGPGQRFDGWATAIGMNVEANLGEIAQAFGIDRDDEQSFDSGGFPKVILACNAEEDGAYCGHCGESLID
jgi:hypothetical protein